MSAAPQIERKHVPLTKFHNATGEYLDMALRSPIILTSHGRKRQIVADSAYFERLEELARGNIIKAMDIQAGFTADMTQEQRERLLANRPTAEEVANDKWND